MKEKSASNGSCSTPIRLAHFSRFKFPREMMGFPENREKYEVPQGKRKKPGKCPVVEKSVNI